MDENRKIAQAWVEDQRARGWPSYWRALYALVKLGVPWERHDAPPRDTQACFRGWYESSRRAGSGLAPEDVRGEIDDFSRHAGES